VARWSGPNDVDGQGGVTSNAGEGGGDPRIGTIAAGKYKVLRLLGRGGMGAVYEAQNVSIGKRVALKFVVVDRSAEPSALLRFHREARAVSAVESAHIVQVFDTGETEGGEPFLVMELLHGEDLGTRLTRGRLAVLDALDLAVQALRGLRRAHAAGIVHRDLKPQNVFLARGDDDRTHVKIVDFGLSKILGDGAPGQLGNSSITQAGTLLGTPLYMSPEQIEAAPDVDHRTDLWSMGAILYEAIAGAPPFVESSYARLVMSICQRDPRPVDELAPGVPPALTRTIARALTRDRAQRFESAEAFLAAILDILPASDRARAAAPSFNSADARPTFESLPDAPKSADPASSDHDSAQRLKAATPVPPLAEPPAPSDKGGGPPPGAELRTYTTSAATLWLSQAPSYSVWRGEVAAPDRLRIEGRDGSVHELRLEPKGVLHLGRTERVGDERNELVYADVASRLAAVFRHDGVRWWIKRREECSVPVQVGARALNRGEEAPLVHGTLLSVGGMRATLVDRRYVTPSVPADTVDAATGLLGRAGLEQEIASFLQRQRPGGLVLLRPRTSASLSTTQPSGALPSDLADHPPAVAATIAVHRAWPSFVLGIADGSTLLLVAGEAKAVAEAAQKAAETARAAGLDAFACGHWLLVGDGLDAGREIELALHAITSLAAEEPKPGQRPTTSLRELSQGARLASSSELLTASTDARRATLLFAIEEQNALSGVGPHVISALEKELSAVVASHAGQGALVAPLAPGVVVACVSRKNDPAATGSQVQCDWHARSPIMDGKAELPRTLSWEVLHGENAATRAAELSRECADPHGVLSALSGGLPYPIAGRVHAAIASSSAIERVKMLFDVLEGTWRFIAGVLVSAWFARRPPAPGEAIPGLEAMTDFHRRHGTREGYALGTWRELARTAARAFEDKGDPIGAVARDVLGVKLGSNQTFETLSNLMQVERNGFAHGHYNEARAAADLPEFEQMTRTLLRALRPLAAWTLVTVEKTEPDLYGELQMVEFIDHTGPFNTGTRRRIGLNSPVRLANVVYLARWREGLVLPLEPMVRRIAHEDKFDLYWMDHLPRVGPCQMSSAVGSSSLKVTLDARRLPPVLRTFIAG
jgi:serine/threonine protein kinase